MNVTRKKRLAGQFVRYLSTYLRKGKLPACMTLSWVKYHFQEQADRAEQKIVLCNDLPKNNSLYVVLLQVGRNAVKINLPRRSHQKTKQALTREHLEIFVMRRLERDHPDLPPFTLTELRNKTGCSILMDWLEENGSEWAEVVRSLANSLPGRIT